MNQPRILIVDDELPLRNTLRAYLEREGYEVETVGDGHAALTLAGTFQPNLVILDVMLPGVDGFTVLQKLRQQSQVYVLMLTAKTEEIDRVLGLTLGADDYLTKPFSVRELVARVQAILRRGRTTNAPDSPEASESPIFIGHLQIDTAAHRVWKRDLELDLTPIEYALLLMLVRHAGRVLSRDQLIEQVWGYDYYGDDRVIDVHIRRLRRKIEDDPDTPTAIVTVRGAGYRFDREGA
jgi:DNA-binding response OmpR family regulator